MGYADALNTVLKLAERGQHILRRGVTPPLSRRKSLVEYLAHHADNGLGQLAKQLTARYLGRSPLQSLKRRKRVSAYPTNEKCADRIKIGGGGEVRHVAVLYLGRGVARLYAEARSNASRDRRAVIVYQHHALALSRADEHHVVGRDIKMENAVFMEIGEGV